MDVGNKVELEYVVKEEDLASALPLGPEDDFPEVLATARMIALMELAAARLMKPLLKEGQLSVGVNINANHMAATPCGMTVKAVAEYKGMEGKLYSFEVSLLDEGGVAGKGTHTRAIVDTARIVKAAQTRGAK